MDLHRIGCARVIFFSEVIAARGAANIPRKGSASGKRPGREPCPLDPNVINLRRNLRRGALLPALRATFLKEEGNFIGSLSEGAVSRQLVGMADWGSTPRCKAHPS